MSSACAGMGCGAHSVLAFEPSGNTVGVVLPGDDSDGPTPDKDDGTTPSASPSASSSPAPFSPTQTDPAAPTPTASLADDNAPAPDASADDAGSSLTVGALPNASGVPLLTPVITTQVSSSIVTTTDASRTIVSTSLFTSVGTTLVVASPSQPSNTQSTGFPSFSSSV